MQRRTIGVATTVALSIALVVGSNARAQVDPASRALEYLRTQQLTDGSVPGPFGGYTPTDLYVIAGAGAGYDPSALRNGGVSAVAFLQSHAADASSTTAKAGLLLQAVVAAKLDPTAFGGVNLLTVVQSAYHAATGAYGDGQIYSEADSILGLRAAHVPVPAKAYTYVENLQDGDGGWNYSATANNSAGSDTNSTAMSLMTLADVTDSAATTSRASGVAWLHAQQTSGGFGSQVAWGVDADSTALVVQTIVALGQSPDSATWTTGGTSAFSALLAQQDADGGFGYQGAPPDTYTSAQAVMGLIREPLPADHVYTHGYSMAVGDAAALNAVAYMQSQLRTDGAMPSAFGPGPDASSTCDLVIAAAAAGIDPATLKHGGTSAIDYLRGEVADPAVLSSAGGLGKLIEAAVADRQDASTFGGRNLITQLNALYHPGTGAFGDGQTITQSLAMLGLSAAHQPIPGAAVTYLHGLRDTDGGWNYTAGANAAAGSDTNSTAMALMALDAAGHRADDAAAVAWLHAQQESDGGFGYQKPWGTDADSTALVIQALVSVHENPGAAAWSSGGNTPVMNLTATQEPGGGFGYQGAPADAFTTSQIPPALLRAVFPVTPAFPVGAVLPPITITPTPMPATSATATPGHRHVAPGLGLPSPTPSASPAPSATPVAAATPSPTAGVQGITTDSPAPIPAVGAVGTPVVATDATWPVYLFAGLAGLLVVTGGGAALMRIRRK